MSILASLLLVVMMMGAEVVLVVAFAELRGLRTLKQEQSKHTQEEQQPLLPVSEHAVFARPRGDYKQLVTVMYPQWLRIVDHTLSIEALRMYDEFGDRARDLGPFSHTDRPCTVKIPTYIEHPGRCVVLGQRGLTGCQSDQHLVPHHEECASHLVRRSPQQYDADTTRRRIRKGKNIHTRSIWRGKLENTDTKNIDNRSTQSDKEKNIDNRSTQSDKEKNIDNRSTQSGKEKNIDNRSTQSDKEKNINNRRTQSGKEKNIDIESTWSGENNTVE